MQLTELIRLLDAQLEPWRFKDYAPNGLQVEGRAEVKKVLTGTTASQALIDAAIAEGADAILVHHGYFWKNEDARIVGIKRARLKALLEHDISLIAYHLPLDAHPTLGNNATLAERLGLIVEGQTGEQGLLWYGRCTVPTTAQSLTEQVDVALARPPLLLGDPARRIERVCWCTGGAQGYFEQAIALGADAFITGEVSEQNYHIAEESGVVFLAAGHHATERYGVRALGDWLAQETGLDVNHAELKNPV
ncbi:Nif3-like dinuclear metal center hexameric protein [Neisseriaceae bacterium JH1-16]|nr:Nif3-like dinuclear metal center hexameric protein [Neisseriaceae bacterium JH1-16]